MRVPALALALLALCLGVQGARLTPARSGGTLAPERPRPSRFATRLTPPEERAHYQPLV